MLTVERLRYDVHVNTVIMKLLTLAWLAAGQRHDQLLNRAQRLLTHWRKLS